MDSKQPLLSICIPTYNRGNFLRIMLQALLPQVAKSSEKVEVLVLDNASTDTTPQIVEVSRELGPFQYVRNVENIGPVRNVLKGPVECATGQYVWILGHHSLMVPGALKRVVKFLESNTELDVFYTNFRCATFPDHWPQNSVGGFDGEFAYLGNKQMEDRKVAEWSELIDAKSALCTQIYAHIVRRSIWKDYWTGKEVGQSFQDSITTYPHTHMLADVAFKSPSLYLGTPTITIFNGAQSWGDPKTQCDVYLRGLPSLLNHFAKHGLKPDVLKQCKALFCVPETSRILTNAINVFGPCRVMLWVTPRSLYHPYLLKSFWRAFVCSDSGVARIVRSLTTTIANRRNWWIVNCLPARWIKAMWNHER